MDLLILSQDARERCQAVQIACGNLMAEKRGVVDDETFDVLGMAYAATGNAAYQIGVLMEAVKQLRSQLYEK